MKNFLSPKKVENFQSPHTRVIYGSKGNENFSESEHHTSWVEKFNVCALMGKIHGKKKILFFSEKISGNGPEHVLKLRSVVACTDARYHLRGHALNKRVLNWKREH
jgi:hypothetical protein